MATLSASNRFWKSVYGGAGKPLDELLKSNGMAEPFSCIPHLTILPLLSFIFKMLGVFVGLKSIDDIVASQASKIVLYARCYELKNGDRKLLQGLSRDFYKESEIP